MQSFFWDGLAIGADRVMVVDRHARRDDRFLVTNGAAGSVRVDMTMQSCAGFETQRSFDVIGAATPVSVGLYLGTFTLGCKVLYLDSGTVPNQGQSQATIVISDVAGGNAVISQQRLDDGAFIVEVAGEGVEFISVSAGRGTFASGTMPLDVTIACPDTSDGWIAGTAELDVTVGITPRDRSRSTGCVDFRASTSLIVVPSRVEIPGSFTIFSNPSTRPGGMRTSTSRR